MHGQDSTRIDQLLRSLDKASTARELKQLVESIRELILLSPSTETQPLLPRGNRESHRVSTLQEVATTLLRRCRARIGGGEGGGALLQTETERIQRGELLEVLLDGCGVANTLFAAMEVIGSLASNPSSAVSDIEIVSNVPNNVPRSDDAERSSSRFPEEACSVLSLILLRSEERLIQLLQDLAKMSLNPFSESVVGAQYEKEMDGSADKWKQQPSPSLQDSFLETWCAQTVLFCRVIANACRARQHPLPSWAVASSTWEARLVGCAIRACCVRRCQNSASPTMIAGARAEASTESGGLAVTPEKFQTVTLRYLQSLLHIILSRGGGSGGAESVAVGIRRACQRRTGSTTYPQQPIAPSPETSFISSVVVHALLPKKSLHAPWSRGYSSLQIAPLCRALVLMGAGTGGSCSLSNDDVKHPWLLPMVRQLLATSHGSTQDLFVQQTLLGTLVPLEVARCVAQLLHSIASYPLNEVDHRLDADDPEEKNTEDDKVDIDDDADDDEEEGREPASPLLRQLCRVSTLWSTGVSEGPLIERQHVLTVFLIESLKLIVSTPATGSSPGGGEPMNGESDRPGSEGRPNLDLLDHLTENEVLLSLMNGVSERLHSSNPSIRRDGMLIGQALGEYVLNEPVVFDELRSHEAGSRPSLPCPSDTSASARQLHPQHDQMRNQLRRTDRGEESTADCSDDSEWEDIEPFQKRYDVEDDEEDLREVPLPLYLNDCLDLLRVSETVEGAYASHQAALQALPRLIRERPGDLTDVGPLLAKQLVVLENKFQIDDFDAMLLAPLCALVAEEPLAVGHALIEDLFLDGSLYNRTLALTALNEAAWELSGNKRLRESYVTGERILRPLSGPRTFGKRHLVNNSSPKELFTSGSNSQTVTRRWGRNRVDKKPNLFTNRFSDIAPGWFYSLVGKFRDRVNDSSLWGGHVGSLLLAHLIQTLSIIVESCGPHHPGGPLLALDLLELVWNFHDAQVAEVRASVLSAVGSCFTVLPQESILRLLLDSGTSQSLVTLPHYIQAAITTDRDPQCRALAEHVASTISRNVTSMGF